MFSASRLTLWFHEHIIYFTYLCYWLQFVWYFCYIINFKFSIICISVFNIHFLFKMAVKSGQEVPTSTNVKVIFSLFAEEHQYIEVVPISSLCFIILFFLKRKIIKQDIILSILPVFNRGGGGVQSETYLLLTAVSSYIIKLAEPCGQGGKLPPPTGF